MAVTYPTATKTARMTAVVTAIGTSGKLKLFTAAYALLATFTLASTAGTVTNGVLTFSDANGATAGVLNTTATGVGTATKASVTTSADVDVAAGDDLEIPSQYQPRLLHWVKHRAYNVQDSEAFDKGASDRYLAMHKAACLEAIHEQNRVRRPVSTVSYGGI